VTWTQSAWENKTDSIVSSAISLSEVAIFDARFEEAKNTVNPSIFIQLKEFNIDHKVLLILQNLRIDRFTNNVYQKTTDHYAAFKKLHQFIGDTARMDKKILGDYFLILSNTYRSRGIIDSSGCYQKKALEIFSYKNNFNKIADIRTLNISLKHTHLRSQGKKVQILALIPQYEEEIEFSKLYNKYSLSFNTRHLGQIYLRHTSNYEKAFELFKRSLDLRIEIGFKPYLPASYSSLGDAYVKMNKDSLAIEMYHVSSEIAQEIGFIRYQSSPNLKIGDIYLADNDFETAKEYYVLAAEYASKNDYSDGIKQAEERIKKMNAIMLK
jgi:tetratricopeptide (TPR) repeat protein